MFYFLSGRAANAVQIWFNWGRIVLAIAAAMGAYLAMFPTSRIKGLRSEKKRHVLYLEALKLAFRKHAKGQLMDLLV